MAATICLMACVRGVERADHFFFGRFLRARLDHHDRVGAAGDDQVDLALLALGVGRIDRRTAPSTRPTRTPAIVFSNGIDESASAADAPVIASTSESFSASAEISSATICVS